MKKYILGCDWGTSSFRLRLIELEQQSVVSEVVSSSGIAVVYNEWKNIAALTPRFTFFSNYLASQIQLLSFQSEVNLEGLPIVISGMASSSIGMYELPYADVPFALTGQEAIVSCREATADFSHDIWLISGVKTENDVMRGEEVQLVGITHWLPFSVDKKYVVLLPGTHSKHLYIQKNSLVDFQTYMTGELFHIVSNHSVLKDSIDKSNLQNSSQQEREAFVLGVKEAASAGMLKSLFQVRTNQLFQKLTKNENAHFMSGVFIGSELKELVDENVGEIVVCCGGNLHLFYALAIKALQLENRTTLIAPEKVEQATVIGQVKLFQNQLLTVSHQDNE